MAFNNPQKAIIHALLYGDMFNFPLTEEELSRNIISDKRIDRNTLKTAVKSLSEIVMYKKGYYCLKGREHIIDQRVKRIKITKAKLEIAKSVAGYLSFIPSIQFIGISGRLSHMDADNDDDIDLFFITKKNSLWITRLLILAVLELLNVRRTRNETNPKNKICPNLIIDETALSWPVEKHDIFIAHEIINIYPLISKNNMYLKFLKSNMWIKQFYANAVDDQIYSIQKTDKYVVLKLLSFFLTFSPVEYIVRALQRGYMKGKRTNETILHNILAFHPNDKRLEIVNMFAEKVNRFNVEINRL